MTEHQDTSRDDIPTKPEKLQLKLLEKKSHIGTDIVSFKFGRRGEDNSQKQSDQDHYLNYKAGQYAVVDLGTKEDPEGPIRSFTLASSPTEDFILISTRIRDTPFKKKLASLEVGISVRITAPLGKFVLHDDHLKAAVLLSGGIGVTPFRSMIKYATDKQLSVKIILFDANRNQDNILYKKEFDECANLNKNLKIVYTLDMPDKDWKGELGHINQIMVTKYLNTIEMDNSIFYICGPPGMLNAMKGLLQDVLGISKERIKVEEFIGY
ncbi:MAG: FAD-dependent oxidoreductase [Candidatus Nitrosopolaris sp.]